MLAYYLNSLGINFWFVFAPVFAINLPAIPLAIVYALMLQDPLPVWKVIGMWVSIIIVSSMGWGSYARWRSARRLA
jgi:hypothetical protein